MALFTGKNGVIMGVANEFSLAAAIATNLHAEGARLAFNHLPDRDGGPAKNARRVQRFAETVNGVLVRPCDVTSDADISAFFERVGHTFGTIDFLVHSIAFAPIADITGRAIDASRDGFKIAMDISVYSFLAIAREAAKLMPRGGSLLTMTYFGGEKVVEGYNLMGLCKAALDAATRYAAADLGPKNIRVNAVSAGPVKTLAASAVGDFNVMQDLYAHAAPLRRNVTPEEVAKAATYLLSDWSSGTTGEIMHVDCGYNVMGSTARAIVIDDRCE